MNILVCIKQVPDTTIIKIDPVTNTLMREGVPAIVSPFDKVGGARVSVVVWLCALCRVMLGRKRAADASPARRAASLPTALMFRHFLGCHDTSLSPHGVRTNSEFCMECPPRGECGGHGRPSSRRNGRSAARPPIC